jgi:tetratricopeptide (TPR) repeat protein
MYIFFNSDSSFFIRCGLWIALLITIFSSCTKKTFTAQSDSKRFDASTVATITYVHYGGKYSASYSDLTFYVHGSMHHANTSLTCFMVGQRFTIKYNSNNPTDYNIIFEEPTFIPQDRIARTSGTIIKKTGTWIKFVYQTGKSKNSTHGYHDVIFSERDQMVFDSLHIKKGSKYAVYYLVVNPSIAVLYTDSLIDSVHSRANYLYYKTQDRILRDRYKHAISLLNRAYDIDPGNTDVIFLRAKAKYQLDKYAHAELDFSKYIALAPDSYDGYLYRSVVRIQLGRYQDAINDLNKAAEINPDGDPDLYCFQGIAYYLSGKYQEAIAAFDKSIKLNHNKGNYYYNRAIARVKAEGKLSSGKADYSKAARLGNKKARKFLRKGKGAKAKIINDNIKYPWHRSYILLGQESGSLPYQAKSSFVGVDFTYQLQNNSTNTSTEYDYSSTASFKPGKTAFGFSAELGAFKSIYMNIRAGFTNAKGYTYFDAGLGYNIKVGDGRVIIFRPELGISLNDQRLNFSAINFKNSNISVLGKSYTSDYSNHLNISYVNEAGTFKPKLGIWLYPRNSVSLRVNAGYNFVFHESTKLTMDHDNGGKYNTVDKFKTSYPGITWNTNGTPVNQLSKFQGLFFNLELTLKVITY